MIYKHKKTGKMLQLNIDSGDIVQCYILDNNLNKILDKRMMNTKYKEIICHKNNLVEVLK